jgi:hypothetical protein
MNKALLHSFMVRFGDTQLTLAMAMGISLSRMNAKINNKSAEFTQSEILFIKNRYKLTARELDEIFFADEVA